MSKNPELMMALDYAQRATGQMAGVVAKIRSGDTRGATARIAFALRDLGNALEELNAAGGKAPDALGMLDPLE